MCKDNLCKFCGDESTIGCGSGGYHYYSCDKCWTDIKRGKLRLIDGEIDEVSQFMEDNAELFDKLVKDGD